MTLNISESYYGFELKKIQDIPDIDSQCFVFLHKKSGAKVFYAKNTDDNKVFFTAFKTPPVDDCGTAHILEHSVLCGSKNYPGKDPFNELIKGSLNTYLNAMTFSDKTMYPVASRNGKDFKKLVDVYLDAIFNPNVIQEEKIFSQEGWHYELAKEDEDIGINGVVYNEMKGAMSSPERILNNAINQSLFPESIYRFESGGDPEAIPSLTFENFKKFYNDYYHPSNSFFYLYGDMDIKEYLEHIDSGYLSNYNNDTGEIVIREEREHSKRSLVSDTYSVPKGGKTENDSMLSLNFLIGNSTDSLLMLSMEILNYILLSTDASPMKKIILNKKIGENVEGWFDSSMYQMVFSIVVKNSTCKKVGLFKETIMRELEKLVQNGIDEDLVVSAVNKFEFLLKEEDFSNRPKGLVYGMEMMKGWLHGQDPIEAIQVKKHIETIRANMDKRYFENLMETYFLDSHNASIAAIAGEEGKQERAEEKLKKELQIMKESMSKIEIDSLIKKTKELKEYQNTTDTQEVLDKIPFLKKEEVDKEAVFDVFEEKDRIIYLPQKTDGIVYTKLLFSTRSVPKELVPYAGILARVIGKLGTDKFDFDVLSTQINKYTGGIASTFRVYTKKNGYMPAVVISGKCFERNYEKMTELIEEIIFNTDFNAVKSLEKVLLALKVTQENYFINNGHLAAILRCKAMFNEESYYGEMVDGIEFSDSLRSAVKNIPETAGKLLEVSKLIFTKENFMAIVSSDEGNLELGKENIKYIQDKLVSKTLKKQDIKIDKNIFKEAVENGGKVVYNAKATNLSAMGIKYRGDMEVIKNIINTEYLWKEVRVKGGAYGCGCQFEKDGKMYFYSYRDPNIKDTFATFNGAGNFLKELDLTEKELIKYILGAINTIDRPMSKATKVDMALARYFFGTTKEDVQKIRDQVLSVTAEGIKALSKAIVDVKETDFYHCTFGSDIRIRENSDFFDEIRQLYKNTQ